MTYITKGAAVSLSKIGDSAKGLKGIESIDIPRLPDGNVYKADGTLRVSSCRKERCDRQYACRPLGLGP